MGEISDRIFGRCGDVVGLNEIAVRPGDLLERVLLFDKYILESLLLKELPTLTRAFGAGPLAELFDSGLVELRCEPISIGQMAQTRFPSETREPRPIGYLRFGIARAARDSEKYTHYIESAIEQLDWGDTPKAERTRAITAAQMALRRSAETAGLRALAQLKTDLAGNGPLLTTALQMNLSRRLGRDVGAHEFRASIQQIDADEFRATSDLETRLGLSPKDAHDAIQGAALAIGALNQRFEFMQSPSAVTGFRESEAALFDGRLAIAQAALSPARKTDQFHRVARVLELPDLQEAATDRRVDLKRFLEIRATPEWTDFRSWLKRSAELSDDEIRGLVGNLRRRLAPVVGSTAGKVVRLIATTAAGIDPRAGLLLGAGAGAIDSFVVERIFPRSGVVTFLGSMYPSMFRKDGD